MLTYSLPPELVSKVDANAAKERLSRANMIEVWLGGNPGRDREDA